MDKLRKVIREIIEEELNEAVTMNSKTKNRILGIIDAHVLELNPEDVVKEVGFRQSYNPELQDEYDAAVEFAKRNIQKRAKVK